MSMGHTCKFFGFSISYTILTLPLSIFYLPFTLFPVFSSLPLPTDNPPCDLYFCDSVPVPVFCLVSFCFCFGGVQLLTVVSLLSFYCSYFKFHICLVLYFFVITNVRRFQHPPNWKTGLEWHWENLVNTLFLCILNRSLYMPLLSS